MVDTSGNIDDLLKYSFIKIRAVDLDAIRSDHDMINRFLPWKNSCTDQIFHPIRKNDIRVRFSTTNDRIQDNVLYTF